MLPAASLNPVPSASALRLEYVGQQIEDVQPPAAILDVAIVKRNCKLMLDAVQRLGVGFRAHVKTHKVQHRPYLRSDLPDADAARRLPKSQSCKLEIPSQ